MEFLGIGYQEIIAILVVALIFLGPERLPQTAYQLGRAVRTMQRYARLVRDEFREELEYLEAEYRGIRSEMEATRAELRRQEEELRQRLRETNEELERVRREARVAVEGNPNGAAGSTPPAAPAKTPSAPTAPVAANPPREPAPSDKTPLVF